MGASGAKGKKAKHEPFFVVAKNLSVIVSLPAELNDHRCLPYTFVVLEVLSFSRRMQGGT